MEDQELLVKITGVVSVTLIAGYILYLNKLKKENPAKHEKAVDNMHTIVGGIFFFGWVLPWLLTIIFGNKDRNDRL
jgi:hypothetical protein